MSDERKPFAEAVEDEHNVFRLYLDGELQGAVLWDYSQAQAMTAALNAAVEAREAKLRGYIEALARCGDAATSLLQLHRDGRQIPMQADYDHIIRSFDAVLDAVREARLLEVVPVAEHAALKKHHEGTWGVLLHHLSETEAWTPIAAALAAEMGVVIPVAPLLIPQSWHLTKVQHQRLQKLVRRPVLSVPIEKERLMNLVSEDVEVVSAAMQQAIHGVRSAPAGFVEGTIDHEPGFADLANHVVSPAAVESGPGRCSCGARWRRMSTPTSMLPPRCPLCGDVIPTETPRPRV